MAAHPLAAASSAGGSGGPPTAKSELHRLLLDNGIGVGQTGRGTGRTLSNIALLSGIELSALKRMLGIIPTDTGRPPAATYAELEALAQACRKVGAPITTWQCLVSHLTDLGYFQPGQRFPVQVGASLADLLDSVVEALPDPKLRAEFFVDFAELALKGRVPDEKIRWVVRMIQELLSPEEQARAISALMESFAGEHAKRGGADDGEGPGQSRTDG